MTDNTFEITGVALKTEWKISFLFGICFIFIWIASVYLYYIINDIDSIIHIPRYIFFGAMFLGLAWGLFFARILGKKMRVKFLFDFSNDYISIQTLDGSVSYRFDYNEITLVSLVGTAKSMRLFKIESEQKKFKIRLGTYGLAPFSSDIDIHTMDKMMAEMEMIFKKYNFIVKKVETANKVFEYRYMK